MLATPGTPGYAAQLKRDRQLANGLRDLGSLRALAARYNIKFAKSNAELDSCKAVVVKKLDELIAIEANGRQRRRPQGSFVYASSITTKPSRRSSISSAPVGQLACAAAAAAAEGAACIGVADGQGLDISATPQALPTSSAKFCSMLVGALTPPASFATSPQANTVSGMGGGASAPRHASLQCSLLQQQLDKARQELQHQQGTIAELQARAAAVEHDNQQLKQQLQATHAAGLRRESRLLAVEQQVQELLAVKQQQAETLDSISNLHSRQEQLMQRQKLDECQVSVVFKTPELLPAEGTVSHVQKLLNRQLSLSIMVQKVQPLGSKQNGSIGSNIATRKHTYKVVLGSSGQRVEVLRAKAKALRGTSMSIDALLTPEQLTSRHHLVPVARQARAAGQTVRWHYGTLFVNGKQYTGPGSLPTPAEQHASTARTSKTKQAQPPVDADGFQTVQRKPSKPQAHPAATASKHGQPRAQQHQQQGSGKAKTKLKGGGSGKAGHPPSKSQPAGQASSSQQRPASNISKAAVASGGPAPSPPSPTRA